MSDKAHAVNNSAGDSLGVAHRLVGRHVISEVLFVNSAKLPQECPQPRAGSFTAIAMHLAHSIAIIISRPLATTLRIRGVPDSGVPRLEFVGHRQIPLPLIRVEDRRALWDGAFDYREAGRGIGMMAHEVPHHTALASDNREDWRTIRLIGAVSFPLVGPSSGRIAGVFVRRAFFPPRSGTTHPPRTLPHAAVPLVMSGRDLTAPAGESCAGVPAPG